jgi:hypothetical protein
MSAERRVVSPKFPGELGFQKTCSPREIHFCDGNTNLYPATCLTACSVLPLPAARSLLMTVLPCCLCCPAACLLCPLTACCLLVTALPCCLLPLASCFQLSLMPALCCRSCPAVLVHHAREGAVGRGLDLPVAQLYVQRLLAEPRVPHGTPVSQHGSLRGGLLRVDACPALRDACFMSVGLAALPCLAAR